MMAILISPFRPLHVALYYKKDNKLKLNAFNNRISSISDYADADLIYEMFKPQRRSSPPL